MNVRTPLTPQRKWQAIAVATIVLVPAFWVNVAGLALLPFVFLALAFLSEHPTPPRATVRAMLVCIPVGIVVALVAGDAVSGVVAGVGAGGIVALRDDAAHDRRWRIAAVALATLYTFVLAQTAGSIVLLSAPVFPFTSIGIADHLAERRWERERLHQA